MRTPTGRECKYFYGDYFRGREHEECRLLDTATPRLAWKPALCANCPVPNILMANACENMVLQPSLGRSIPLFKQQVNIKTFCSKTKRSGFDAHLGCGECHVLPAIFKDNHP